MIKKLKILLTDNISPQAVELLQNKGFQADTDAGENKERLLAKIDKYDALIVRSNTLVNEKLLNQAKKLKAVGRAGIGVDNIDQKTCTKKGIVVMNSPSGNATTTAEHTLALIFSLARHIPQADNSTQTGKWEKNKFIGIELNNKVLGLIGAGNIGSIVAKKALGLGLKVIVYDPYLSEEKATQLKVKKLDWENFLKNADIISLHIPKTQDTIGIITETEIKKMKTGVMIINCARGGLVDEIALKKNLENKKIGGVALDVYQKEPATENILFGLPNVICTPHLGAATKEAQVNVALQIADQIADFLLSGAVKNSLNTPSITAGEAKILAPYLQLANHLSSFVTQLTKDQIQAINIEYEGEILKLNFQHLTQLIIKNILDPIFDAVNIINAREIAKERGIEVSITQRDVAKDYQSFLRISVTWAQKTRSLAGSLFRNKPRLVEIKNIALESEFKPHMLYIANQDKPGFIGELGSLLGKHQINIASFHLGRSVKEQSAIALLELDQPIPLILLQKIKKLNNVLQAQTLKF